MTQNIKINILISYTLSEKLINLAKPNEPKIWLNPDYNSKLRKTRIRKL
jgi:hypothetical protein